MNRKESFKNLRILLYPTLALVLFAVFGQIACDQLGSVKGMFRQWVTIALTLVEICGLLVCIRLLSMSGKALLVARRILGAVAAVFMLFVAWMLTFTVPDQIETYGADWWIGQVDKLEEEQHLWSVSHWIGRGDAYYEYDDSIAAVPAKSETEAMEEPYHSAVDERACAEVAYKYYYSDTMLNVLSYVYGRWVWLVYLAIVITWTAAGIWVSFQVRGLPTKLLYFASWTLFTVVIWLPALNGCGLHFSYYGPPFTGFGSAYWEYNFLMVGPPLGVVISLTIRKSYINKETDITPEAANIT